jgi:hypothetical protein
MPDGSQLGLFPLVVRLGDGMRDGSPLELLQLVVRLGDGMPDSLAGGSATTYTTALC